MRFRVFVIRIKNISQGSEKSGQLKIQSDYIFFMNRVSWLQFVTNLKFQNFIKFHALKT